MNKIAKDDWLPSDGLKLEPNAFDVARSDYNTLVIAGPGAGKTELLAQRACYLLQTNLCSYPRKILAISFKADAAKNLGERVVKRVGDEFSRRFDSLTFDSFAKGIFDRFRTALPEHLKVKREYIVGLTDELVLDNFRALDETFYNTYQRVDILKFFYQQLPYSINHPHDELKDKVWRAMLNRDKPIIPFKMIMRLADLIIHLNPQIKSYLQQTYQYVFLDEFQDTTDVQYDFLKRCFFGSKTIFTAVGDDKQRIMIWAGAKSTAFADFTSDVGAKPVALLMNFRSAPRLVALQNYLVKNLLNKPEESNASDKWKEDDGQCYFWVFNNNEHEKRYLLQQITNWLFDDGISPRDICILVKQSLNVYVGGLIEYFNANGIKTRDESELQNILSEELTVYLLNHIASAFNRKKANEFIRATEFIFQLNGTENDDEKVRQERELILFQQRLITEFNQSNKALDDFKILIDDVLAFTGIEKIKSNYPQYKDGTYLEYLIKGFYTVLSREYSLLRDMNITIDSVVGLDTIPVMTVHKSKGLEYHTVIFIGLEDGAFWTYRNQPDEDNCTFFVALSRAKERVVFTFARQRPDRFGNIRAQNIKDIEKIYSGLEKSQIATVSIIQ